MIEKAQRIVLASLHLRVRCELKPKPTEHGPPHRTAPTLGRPRQCGGGIRRTREGSTFELCGEVLGRHGGSMGRRKGAPDMGPPRRGLPTRSSPSSLSNSGGRPPPCPLWAARVSCWIPSEGSRGLGARSCVGQWRRLSAQRSWLVARQVPASCRLDRILTQLAKNLLRSVAAAMRPSVRC